MPPPKPDATGEKYSQIMPDATERPASSMFTRMQDALRAATGIDTRGSEWSGMSTAEKRKRLFRMYRANGMDDDAISWLGEKSDSELDAQLGKFARSQGTAGGVDSEARDLLKPKDTSTPFGATSGPFERMGAILAKRLVHLRSTNDWRKCLCRSERARDEMRVRPSVSFMGLQDLQRSVQQSIGEDESRRDK